VAAAAVTWPWDLASSVDRGLPGLPSEIFAAAGRPAGLFPPAAAGGRLGGPRRGPRDRRVAGGGFRSCLACPQRGYPALALARNDEDLHIEALPTLPLLATLQSPSRG
jgi:hypothetical protein